MSAEELAEHEEWLRKHPHVVIKPTRKYVANIFKGHKKRITEKLNALAYSPDARSLAREYVTFQQVIDHARGYCPDGPALPEMPALIGNDYYAGMIRLADYCTMAADVLDGRKAPDGDGGQAGAGKGVVKRFPPGKRSKAWQELRRIVKAATKNVWLEDAYVSSDVVDLLTEDLPESAKLRVLGPVKENKWWEGALASLKRLGADLPGRVEVRVSEDVHDRYIYVDDRVWRSDDSFKDMAAKKTTQIIDEGDRSAELITDFKKRWSSAQQVYPPATQAEGLKQNSPGQRPGP